jgi:hypothetical protein
VFPNAKQTPQLQHWSTAKSAFVLERDRYPGLSVRTWRIIEGNLGRSARLTTKNGYFRITAAAQKEDHITVLAGCNVPVILQKRKAEATYEFSRTCFVYGFMVHKAYSNRVGLDTQILETH